MTILHTANGLTRYDEEMKNPGYIPPFMRTDLVGRDDERVPCDGEQHSLDLRVHASLIVAEIERWEAWELLSVQRLFLADADQHSWLNPRAKRILDRQLELLDQIWGEEEPFACMSLEEHVWAIEGFSGNEPQTPADVVQLYESLMGAVQRKLLLNKECTEEDLAEIAHAEALSYCAKRWNDPRCRSVVRWVLDPGGLVNVAREGALARTRFWIKRVTSGKFAAWNRSDLIGLLPLSRAVLSRVRSAYTWEAPGSFLGDADLDIVRWTYPLVCGMPAESTVSDEQLAHEWNTSGLPDSGVSVDELRREYSGIEEFALDRRYLWYSEWMSSSGGEYANPDAYDVDFECRAAGLRLVAIAMREAKRFGITDFEDLPDIANETQALEWVERIIARTMALGSELPSDPVSKSIVREPYSTSIPQAGTTSAMSARFTAKLPKSFLCWILDDVTDKSLAPKLLEYGIRLHPEDSLPNRKQTLRLEVDSLVNTPLYHESNRAELLQNWKRRTPK